MCRSRPGRRTGGVSLSARRAWIEMWPRSGRTYRARVALRKESVDRNMVSMMARPQSIRVALRKESVDRNNGSYTCTSPPYVALRKESVDRNIPSHWITSRTGVALRKESVDRNSIGLANIRVYTSRSPQGERG